MPSWGVSKYIETKLQPTFFYLVSVAVLETVRSGAENTFWALALKFLLTRIIIQVVFRKNWIPQSCALYLPI